MYKVILIIIALILFYFGLEIIKKRFIHNTKITRKIAHVISGIVAIILLYWFSQLEFIILLCFFSLLFIVAKKYNLFKAIHLTERQTWGEVFYPLGLLLVVIFFYQQKMAAVAAILVLVIADPIAEYIGGKHGKKKKSLIGSLGFFISAWISIIFLVIAVFNVPSSLIYVFYLTIVALLATLTEALSVKGLDNLTVPIVVAISLVLLF